MFEAKEDLNGFIPLPREVLSDPRVQPAPSEGMTLEWIDEKWLGHRALVIHNFFSPSECQAIIDFCEGRTPEKSVDSSEKVEISSGIMIPAHSRTEYRNNLRVIAKSTELASLLFDRLLPFLGKLSQEPPSENSNASTPTGCQLVITPANAKSYEDGGIGVVGTWTPTHLNPAFRICKYLPDGHFGPHYDGEFFESYTCRSFKTFMIYLNDNYDNGCTNFLEEHSIHYDAVAKRYQAPEGCVRAKLKAKQGDLLLFDHLLLHEGETVTRGVKYIIRSECMYTRAPAETAEEKRLERGYTLLREAKDLESQKLFDEAVAKYRAAYKVAPELERLS